MIWTICGVLSWGVIGIGSEYASFESRELVLLPAVASLMLVLLVFSNGLETEGTLDLWNGPPLRFDDGKLAAALVLLLLLVLLLGLSLLLLLPREDDPGDMVTAVMILIAGKSCFPPSALRKPSDQKDNPVVRTSTNVPLVCGVNLIGCCSARTSVPKGLTCERSGGWGRKKKCQWIAINCCIHMQWVNGAGEMSKRNK